MTEEQKQLETTLEHLEESSELFEATKSEKSANLDATITVETDLESRTQDAVTPSDEQSEGNPGLESAVESHSELPVASLQQEIELLKQQLEEQTQQVDILKNRYIRTTAEFDNFRKRTQKEKEDLEKQVKRNTLSELLSVVDNFERARTQIKPANDGEMGIHKSYQGVYKNLVDSLKRLGVASMRPEGEPFDPNYHEAMLREATNDYPEGTVIEQLVRGYLLDDRVLRHALVKVAAPQEPGIVSEEETIEEQDKLASTDN
jgi:molecular chaperone GrpE